MEWISIHLNFNAMWMGHGLWQDGVDYVLHKDGELVAYRTAASDACCPIQAEAEAVREVMFYVKGRVSVHVPSLLIIKQW